MKYYVKFGNKFSMSRLGKKPILIPEGIEVKLEDGILTVKGPLGKIQKQFKDDIIISISKEAVKLEPKKLEKRRGAKKLSALWGTYASAIRNMIKGVSEVFQKKLVIEGVGYRAQKEGLNLVLNVGFTHQVKIPVPEGIDVKIEKNIIAFSGVDKELVGTFASRVRDAKKPEPYKGKGIRYEDEIVRHKAGKKAVASAI